MSSKNRMLEARDLIQEEKFDEARAILQDIDHPTAREWLDKLNQVSPAARTASTRNWGRLIAVLLVAAVVIIGVVVIVTQSGG